MRSPSLTALLASLALLLAVPAAADNTADEADVAFQLGNEAYARGQYAEALRNYFLSHRLVPNRNVLFNIARCYESARRYDEAYRYFHDLSQLELPRADAESVAAALKRILPRVALVEVTSTPPGASVYADREDLGSRGSTPLQLALPAGKHLLRVRLPGHAPAETTVQLSPGKVLPAALQLSPLLGAITVSGRPEGAELRASAEGPVLGRIPATVKLPVGRRTLSVTHPGYAPGNYPLEVTEAAAKLEVVLAPEAVPTGTLLVTANRDAALVRVDGREAGFTPVALSLREGEHAVEVTHPDARPWTQAITVARDGSQKVHAELRYAPPAVQAASKRLLSVDDAPASTTVITREELLAFGYTSLAEALQAVRGIFLSNDRQYDFLGIRGFNPPGDLNTRVLILWDGHSMNDVWAGQGYAGRDLAVDLEEVERIEVVRGPGSALYGTGAFFAVINVVPRDRLQEGRSAALLGAAGSGALWRTRLTGSVGAADRGITLSAAALDAAGAETTDLGEYGLIRGLDGERIYGGSLRARSGGFTLHGLVNARTKQVPTAPYGAQPGAPGAATRDSRGFLELRYDHDFSEAASVSARAYYDHAWYLGTWPLPPDAEGNPTPTQPDIGEAQWAGGELRGRFSPFKGNTLTGGLEVVSQFRIRHRVSDLGAEERKDEVRSRLLLSAYLLDEWALLPGRLALTAGLRVDRYLDLGVTPITPRLALILRPYAGGLTKLVAGSAFRAPNVYELYYQEGTTQVAPPNGLQPETIQTFELEHSHDLTDELRLTVGGYWNNIQKLVVSTEETGPARCGVPDGSSPCVVNVNTATPVRALGGEAELRWQPARFALVDVAYSFVSSTSDNRPAHLGSAKVMVPLVERYVRLSTQAVYQSLRRSDRVPQGAGEALLLNFGLSGERDHFRYFAGVTNLLDARYSLPVNEEFRQATIPQHGRGFLLQVTGSY